MAPASAGLETSLPPYLGRGSVQFARLRARVLGRMARLDAFPLQPLIVAEIVVAELGVWLLAGYPEPLVAKVAASLPWWPESRGVVRQMGRGWLVQLRGGRP